MADEIIIKVSLEGAKEELNNLEKLKKEIDRLAAAKKELNATIKKNGKATKEQIAQQVENATALKLNRDAYRQNERQVINNTKAQKLNEGSLVQLRSALNKDTFAYDRLTKAERDNVNVGGRLRKSIKRQSDALKELENQTGRNQRSVGDYKKSFGSLRSLMMKGLGALGITAGLAGLVNVMKGAVKIAKDFEQGNANLAAVLGKTRKEIKTLTDDAKRLGAITSFTASEVSKLQTEFAKLGFNEKEILNATEATLSLAAATGSDLAEAAAIAGATLGGFGLDAKETQRITDVMAKSFSTSALDIEKFRESMKSAAPAARAVGVSVEETTALLGTLANAGISGSIAGTALRKTFIELNAAGLTLDEGLKLVADSEDQLGAASDLVGKKAASSFLVLANGTKTTKELEKGLNNAGGAAKKMADEQLDTLEGKTKILGSAWEGLVLSLLAGDGAFSSISRSIVEGATGLIGFVTQTDKLSDAMEEERIALQSTKLELISANTTTERRKELIDELKKSYPKYLENIDSETASNEQLIKAIGNVNKGLINKIILQQKSEEIAEQNNKSAEASIKLLKAEDTLRKRFGASLDAFNEDKAKADQFNIDSQKTELENAKALVKAIDAQGGSALFASFGRNKLAVATSELRARTNLLNQEEEKGNALFSEKEKLMTRLGIQTEITTDLTDKEIAALKEKEKAAAAKAAAAAAALLLEEEASKGLIAAQKKLKKIAEEMPELTEAEITAKNQKINLIDKEISRLKNLGETEEELNKKKSELIDDEITDLKLVRQLELATIDETNAQKIEKERALLDTIGALRVEKAMLNGEDVARVEQENRIAKAEQENEFEALLKEQEEVTKEEEKEAQEVEDGAKIEKKKLLISQTADLVEQGGKALIAAASSRLDREKDIELANLDAKLEGGLITQAEFESKKVEIEKKAFNKKKKLDLAVIAIDLAKEISAISASAAANPLNAVTFGGAGVSQAAILTGFAIARSGIQAGIVASQKFSKGGVIHGASHAQGGVQLGNNQEGEGGEAIINKRSTMKHINLLSAINEDGGGVPLAGGLPSPNLSTVSAKFANGGVLASGGSTLNIDDLRQAFSESVGAIKVQNVASETTGVANRVQQIEDSASF